MIASTYFIFCLLIPGLAVQLTARLANGTYRAGRLEILYQGEWGTACGYGFGQEEARVACRMLGLNSSGAVVVKPFKYGAGTGRVLFVSLACQGTETSLAQCRHGGFYNSHCEHSGDVGVICANHEEMRARLVNGTSEAGRLEIFFNGEWSTVRGLNFDKEDALVACRMLGFNSTDVATVSSAKYGAGTGAILFDNLHCVGTETSFAQCRHEPCYSLYSCTHQQDVGVMCNTVSDIKLKARLVNGTSQAGRLEILFNGEWSTVCGRNFDKEDALVACRMLGFNSTAVAAVGSDKVGEGTGTILIDDLECVGTETSLAQCKHPHYYSLSCSHVQDVGVICNQDKEMKARLVNGTAEVGRLEIFVNGEWSTVCDAGFGNDEALVACRMLGFNGTAVAAVDSTKYGPWYGPGTGTILFDYLECVGRETSLAQCKHPPYYSLDCNHMQDVGVDCNTAGILTARLVNGTSWAGRLEISYRGEWSTVCHDYFQKEDAQVACRMMGLNSYGAAAVSSSIFGPGTGKIVLDDLACQGTETNLAQCGHRGFYNHKCRHAEDVGVICVIPGQLTGRLFGGTPWAGRLEIFHDGSWKTVCDDAFGKEEAQVGCRMVGYNSPKAVAVGSAVYGVGQGEIFLDDLKCQGTETSLTQCQHGGYGKHNCGHSKDVGLICKFDANYLRLVGSGRLSHDMGRVQFLLGTDWTTLCLSNFNDNAAKVLCRQLNLPSKTATMVTASSFGPSQRRFMNVNLMCTGGEPSILHCLQTVHTFTNTCSTQDVGVICSNSNSSLYIVLDTNLTSTKYPLLEGASVRLRCRNTQQGQSGVVYTWPETAGGRPLGEYLIFDNVTRAHHGRRMRCTARQSLTSDALEMQVYSPPSITIKWDASACENMNIHPNQCVVRQKQNVTVWCNADSNPRPASTRWSGKMSSNTGRLQITAADNAKHTGQYICTVTTATASGDSRLPLTSSHRFNIAVTYPSKVVRFQLNGESELNVTVDENSTVRILCKANGRPTPHMVLVSGPDNNRLLATRLRGAVSLTEQRGELSHVMNRTPCDATGDYRCEVDNGIGSDSRTIRLVVRCLPRNVGSTEALSSLDIHDSKDLLVFEMTAHPVPYVRNITYIGLHFKDDIEGTSAESKLQVDCVSSSFAPASVTCNIAAVNMTRADIGYYKIVFSNSLGQLPFVFRVCSKESSTAPTTTETRKEKVTTTVISMTTTRTVND